MQTDALLDRFLTGLEPLAPLAVWAHGSLAGGDYQEGRSDLDLIAVLDRPISPRTTWRLAKGHARLRDEPLAPNLHCTYLTPDAVENSARPHLTWAHEQLFKRPVTPVTRRELHTFGRVLHGKGPAGLLPPVPDLELDEFVVRDQRDFWRPKLEKAERWRQALGRRRPDDLRPRDRHPARRTAHHQAGGAGAAAGAGGAGRGGGGHRAAAVRGPRTAHRGVDGAQG